jgi:hypothetical protein
VHGRQAARPDGVPPVGTAASAKHIAAFSPFLRCDVDEILKEIVIFFDFI